MVGMYWHSPKETNFINVVKQAIEIIIDNNEFGLRLRATDIKPHLILSSKNNWTISLMWYEDKPEKTKGEKS